MFCDLNSTKKWHFYSWNLCCLLSYVFSFWWNRSYRLLIIWPLEHPCTTNTFSKEIPDSSGTGSPLEHAVGISTSITFLPWSSSKGVPYRNPLSIGCLWVYRSQWGRSGKYCLLHLNTMGSSYTRPFFPIRSHRWKYESISLIFICIPLRSDFDYFTLTFNFHNILQQHHTYDTAFFAAGWHHRFILERLKENEKPANDADPALLSSWLHLVEWLTIADHENCCCCKPGAPLLGNTVQFHWLRCVSSLRQMSNCLHSNIFWLG